MRRVGGGLAAILAIAALLACSQDAAPRTDDAPSEDGTAPADAPPHFDERVAVLLLADSTAIARLRAENSEDDFYVIADDLMFYRAESIDWLERHGIPTASVERRDTLRFLVRGRVREFDYSADPLLDLIVLYDHDRPPVAVAAVDVPAEASRYFRLPDPAP